MKNIIFKILLLILVHQVITKSFHKRAILNKQPDLLKAVSVYCLKKSRKLCSEEHRRIIMKNERERQEKLHLQREMNQMKESMARIFSNIKNN